MTDRHPASAAASSARSPAASPLYYRLRWLWPLLYSPLARRGWRWVGRGLFAAWLLFVLLVLALRFVVLPRVGDYQPQIEAALAQTIGQGVRIGGLQTRWMGLNPDLVLNDFTLLDRQGAPALTLSRVEAVLSWQTLFRGPTLALLAIEQPVLHVRREADGRLSVAGVLAEAQQEPDPAFAQWLLRQQRIRIRNATIVWEDRLRGAPALVLEDLQFGLDNRGRYHAFGLSAAPPAGLAARIDLRGEVEGDVGDALDALDGRLYLELDYADLAGWQPWVDYPVSLPRGRGALRMWGGLAGRQGEVTIDLALEDVQARLGPQLPVLRLASLRGRFQGSYRDDRGLVAARQLELLTEDGLRMAPTDFEARWRVEDEQRISGSASANWLDLGMLARLADYLPLDGKSRQLLAAHRPRGRVGELRLSWSLAGDALERYALRARFDQLGMQAGGYFPGAHGLTGSVDLNERSGHLLLDAGASGLSLPRVFPEPDLVFDRLSAKVDWTRRDGATEVQLARLAFAGPHATGGAQGRYVTTGEGPGVIDLTATIDHAPGNAIWRFMPGVVNADARAWLKRGLPHGTGRDGRLVLKGDLRHFPFRDPATGTFEVTARAVDATVDYAPGWPRIEHVDARLRFGVGMLIEAERGQILGTQLTGVRTELPDFEASEEMLLVRGGVEGPTAEFLRFVDQSPVGRKIDRFTEGMRARGQGRLDLALDIPLRNVNATRVRGDYAFADNQLSLVDGLPPLEAVNGRLRITEDSIAGQGLTGRAFGGPFQVEVGSQGGKVTVQAAGRAQIEAVARHFGWPLVDRLSGATDWKAAIDIRRRQAEVKIDADLLGVSSPLPPPLAKAPRQAWPLRVVRGIDGAGDEQYRITLGTVGEGTIVRRDGRWARGVFAVGGASAALPAQGLAIRARAAEFALDAWQPFLPAGNGKGGGNGNAADEGLVLDEVQLDTPRLQLFGSALHEASVRVRPASGGYAIAVASREARGDLVWQGDGEGRVSGRLKHLQLRPEGAAKAVEKTPEVTPEAERSLDLTRLPAMDLAVDDLRLGDIALGRLALKAHNAQGTWRLDHIGLVNSDGELTGNGAWANGEGQQTRLDFDLQTGNIGGLLTRLGHADAVKGGTARLRGRLGWQGTPVGIDYPSLNGQFAVEARQGQFNKLEPGVGKLLGLLSLQSLPRRFLLDFRDVFSDGLAFDRVEGSLVVRQGDMRTVPGEALVIASPAARIAIEGSVRLADETQELDVEVQPEISNVAALGAAIVNPVAGAATFVASTVLRNPLNSLLSYRYRVTGNWDNPVIEQTGRPLPLPSSGEKRP